MCLYGGCCIYVCGHSPNRSTLMLILTLYFAIEPCEVQNVMMLNFVHDRRTEGWHSRVVNMVHWVSLAVSPGFESDWFSVVEMCALSPFRETCSAVPFTTTRAISVIMSSSYPSILGLSKIMNWTEKHYGWHLVWGDPMSQMQGIVEQAWPSRIIMPNMEDMCTHDLHVVAMCLLTSKQFAEILYSNNGACMPRSARKGFRDTA